MLAQCACMVRVQSPDQTSWTPAYINPGYSKMGSNKYVAGWPLQKTAGLKREAARWSFPVFVAAIDARHSRCCNRTVMSGIMNSEHPSAKPVAVLWLPPTSWVGASLTLPMPMLARLRGDPIAVDLRQRRPGWWSRVVYFLFILLYKSYSKYTKKIQQLYKNKHTNITNGKI